MIIDELIIAASQKKTDMANAAQLQTSGGLVLARVPKPADNT